MHTCHKTMSLQICLLLVAKLIEMLAPILDRWSGLYLPAHKQPLRIVRQCIRHVPRCIGYSLHRQRTDLVFVVGCQVYSIAPASCHHIRQNGAKKIRRSFAVVLALSSDRPSWKIDWTWLQTKPTYGDSWSQPFSTFLFLQLDCLNLKPVAVLPSFQEIQLQIQLPMKALADKTRQLRLRWLMEIFTKIHCIL